MRPKGARLEEPEGIVQMRAALSGRLDAVSSDGVLGLQRAIGKTGTASLMEDDERSPVHDVLAAWSSSLDAATRADMEMRLGHDFHDVRVHTDDRAHESARAVNARAYTVGSHVVFQRSSYDPASPEGRRMLAHELTHVVQQRNGPVDGALAPGGIRVSDPSDRFEREAAATAERVISPATPVTPTAGSTHLQRQEAGEEENEEPVQRSFLQRAEAGGEEQEETAQ